ncbi:hypothetical protein OG884_12200 [Streptosporangium sp. NBC_01755]|uniref:hypothetical protein n=1 Tax=unclassified Streptosporangium TaxID=2632669 RepID=UPI002DD9187C|nr:MULTISPECIES: hypothetical protein [unclassified Streptosporangium]WSA25990.1 hypothetical protein OIE13_34690 [Streptosporangium sp. NBC_01810]WSD02624.1 hypothetical protein OG884_12200 [Streptosporangium sp. NBC_01755]
MKPVYEVRAWQEDGWWLARVMAAGDGADSTPLNALTQARTLTKIEYMARDLIATILDVEQDAFEIELMYDLPNDVGELLCEAKGARAWLDAAQELWQERSTIAARALTEKGYSLRETATLLGLSHQRVDQLLRVNEGHGRSNVLALQVKIYRNMGSFAHCTKVSSLEDADVVLVLRSAAEDGESGAPGDDEMREKLREQLRAAIAACLSRTRQSVIATEDPQECPQGVRHLNF